MIVLFIATQLLLSQIFRGLPQKVKELFNGVELRISAYHYPPLMSIIKLPGGNYTYEGLYIDPALVILAEMFNVTFKHVHVDQKEAMGNNIADLLKGQLKRKEVDMSNYFFEITLESMEYMALSLPHHTTAYTLLQPWPQEESRLTAPIRPFSWSVWLCFLGSTAVFVMFMSTIAVIQRKSDGRSLMFRDTLRSRSLWGLIYTQFEYVLTIITSQGNYIRYTTNSLVKMAIVLWLLPMLVLVYAYTGTLTACLTFPKLEPLVSTLEQVAASRKFRLTVEKSRLMADIIFNGTEKYNEKFRQDFYEDPTLLNGDPLRILDNVANHQCVYAGSTFMCNLLLREDVKARGKCRMTLPTATLSYFTMYHTGFPKGSPYSGPIDLHYNLPFEQYGFQQHILDSYFPPTKRCLIVNNGRNKVKVISLTDLTAPFSILVMGLSMASIAFVLETSYYYFFNKKQLLKSESDFKGD